MGMRRKRRRGWRLANDGLFTGVHWSPLEDPRVLETSFGHRPRLRQMAMVGITSLEVRSLPRCTRPRAPRLGGLRECAHPATIEDLQEIHRPRAPARAATHAPAATAPAATLEILINLPTAFQTGMSHYIDNGASSGYDLSA